MEMTARNADGSVIAGMPLKIIIRGEKPVHVVTDAVGRFRLDNEWAGYEIRIGQTKGNARWTMAEGGGDLYQTPFVDRHSKRSASSTHAKAPEWDTLANYVKAQLQLPTGQRRG